MFLWACKLSQFDDSLRHSLPALLCAAAPAFAQATPEGAAPTYATPAAQAAAEKAAATGDTGGQVVVTGIRASLAKAIEIKKLAVDQVDAISATYIGKLPDKNAADALQRIVGVNTESAASGEGGFDENDRVSIRGTSPSLTQVTIDGHSVATGDWFIRSAGVAWRAAIGLYVDLLRASPDRRLAARADDLADLERQVLMALSGAAPEARVLPEAAILLAEDLLRSELLALDASRIAGLCLAGGGPTSHVAILAAAMNVPALVAAGPGVLSIADGTPLILDGDNASLRIAPDVKALEAAEAAVAARKNRRTLAQAAAFEPCHTADGVRIEVFANVGGLSDAKAATASGAEGCGLLRNEFLFLDRPTPPSEDEQAAQYQAIATALGGRPLTVRTLDVGGDKPVSYLPIPPEENPALGLRGVRVSLWRPDLLREQIRAVLRVGPHGQCRIMVPMVASLDELLAVRAVVDEVRAELDYRTPVQVGVMIETPAAAVTADIIAAEADFLSIGTNDLTQYALAMDRGNPRLAARVDSLHPAVLRLIAQASAGAARHGRPVCVCGGLASDLAAAPILIGLGVTELSAMPAVVPELKGLIRTLDLTACRNLAEAALDLPSAADVRALAAGSFPAALPGVSQ